MNIPEVTFDERAWDLTLDTLRAGGSIDASRFLAALEGESDEAVEAAFGDLCERRVALDVSRLRVQPGGEALAQRLNYEEKLVRAGALPQGLEENDPLRLYLEELAYTGVPAIAPQALAQRVADGDADARAMLAGVCLSRVVETAYAFVGRGALLLDLIQDGSLGLWQGILRYEGGDFDAYADWWIRQAMAQSIVLQARANGVGAMLRGAMRDYRAAEKALLAELGRNPTVEQIAQRLRKPPEDAAQIGAMLRDTERAARIHAQEDSDRPVEDTAYFQSRQRILELLSCLDARDAQILTMRFGLDGDAPLTPEQAAAKLAMTPDELLARENAALAQIKANTD